MKKSVLVGLFCFGLPSWVLAQDVPLPARRGSSALDPTYDVLLCPILAGPAATGQSEGDKSAPATDIDIADRVLSAAKQVTTVQEAPRSLRSFVVDEIKPPRLSATSPRFWKTSQAGSRAPTAATFGCPLVGGTAQAALRNSRDGVSMFEPTTNTGTYHRSLPLERPRKHRSGDRTGRRAVGRQLVLGIVNLISKDADDINGLELSAGYGETVPVSRRISRLRTVWQELPASKKRPQLSIVQHVSYETYLGSRLTCSAR